MEDPELKAERQLEETTQPSAVNDPRLIEPAFGAAVDRAEHVAQYTPVGDLLIVDREPTTATYEGGGIFGRSPEDATLDGVIFAVTRLNRELRVTRWVAFGALFLVTALGGWLALR